MATFNTDIAAKQKNPIPANLLDTDQLSTRTGTIPCVYTADGTEANGDVIDILKVEPGDVLISYQSAVVSSGLGSGVTCTLNIGDTDGSGDADRYATALDVAAVGRDLFDENPNTTLTGKTSDDAPSYYRATIAGLGSGDTMAVGETLTFWMAVNRR